MTTIIAVGNQKGGTGKTTTAVTLSHGLALAGYSVLLIDLDAQGNVADCLGLQSSNALYTLFRDYEPQTRQISLKPVITPSNRTNLDVIRSDKQTVTAKKLLSSIDFGEKALQDIFRIADDVNYDIIILDCAPSVDLLMTNALIVATHLIIPLRLEQLSLKGLRDMLQSLRFLRDRGETRCQLAGIVPTFFERVTKESHIQLKHLATTFQKTLMPPVPVDTQCREASRHGKTLWEFAPTSRALVGYENKKGDRVGGYLKVLDRVKELL